jgi:hypothetical protein
MEEEKTNQRAGFWIIGINLLVLIGYTVYFDVVDKNPYNIIGVAMLNAIQFVICLITAIFVYRKEFLLSAGLILLIGFSTCAMVLGR